MKKAFCFTAALLSLALFSTQCFAAIKWIPLRLSLFPPVTFLQEMNVYGIDAGLLSTQSKNVFGLQFSPLFSSVPGELQGVQLACIANNSTVRFSGGQIAAVLNSADDFTGLQTAAFNISGNGTGFQLAGAVNQAKDLTGVQLAGVINVSENIRAVQIAGVSNIAQNVTGVQISPFSNTANEVTGIQIGLINGCNTLRGIQIGLINVVSKPKIFPVLLGINAGW